MIVGNPSDWGRIVDLDGTQNVGTVDLVWGRGRVTVDQIGLNLRSLVILYLGNIVVHLD